MTAQNELSALISKTVEEQTFSLDAVKAIGAIRDRALALEAQLAKSEERNDKAQDAIAKRDKTIAEHLGLEASFLAREVALNKREEVMTNLEKGTAVAQAQFQVLNSVFSTIFANRLTRETVTKSVPLVMPAQYSGGPSFVSTHNETTTNEKTEG